MDSRDQIMGTRLDELDQLAFSFASEVNATHDLALVKTVRWSRPLCSAVGGKRCRDIAEVEAGIIADPNTSDLRRTHYYYRVTTETY